MGAKYSSQSTSGYNASPPADDGTQAASNLITWAGIKAKLADVLKTFGEAINTALVAAFAYDVRQISTSDSVVAGDNMRIVEIAPTATTGVTVTLADAATMTANFRFWLKNSSPHQQTIARATGGDTIDGTAANITIPSKAAYMLQTTTGANGYLIASAYPLEITNLAELGAPPDESDTFPFYDLSATSLKKVQQRYLRSQLGTEQATTSGTEKDFTIPPWAKKIIVSLIGVSTNGTNTLLLQLGDSGGVEATGYNNGSCGLTNAVAAAAATATTGFSLSSSASATAVIHGQLTLVLEDASDFTWSLMGITYDTATPRVHLTTGTKALSAALTTVRLTAGGDTFDAGAINILYE